MAVLSALIKGVDELSGVFDRISNSGSNMANQMETAGSTAGTAFASASDGATATASATQSATTSQNSLTDALEGYDKTAKTTADTTKKATEQVDDYGESTERARDSSGRFEKQSVSAVTSLKQALVAAGLVVAVAAIASAFMACSDAAAEFETSVAKVSTVADTTNVSLHEIQGAITDLSNATGQKASDISEAVYGAISAGVDTANAVEFVASANKLAVGGFTQTETAVDVLTTAINAYGLEVEQATSISDMLITTQNLGKTTVDELAGSVGKVIPIAAAYGVEMDNLSAAYAVTTSNGIATAEAGTYLKQMLTELGSSSSEVGDILLNETGMSFAQLMQDGNSLGDVLEILGQSVGGNVTAFSNLWGSTTAGTAALSIFNSGADAFNGTLDEMQNSAGATATAYGTMSDTTAVAQQRMQTSAENLKIAIGEQLNPAMGVFYDTASNVVGAITGFVQENPAVVAGVTAMAVVLGVVTVAVVAATAATAIWNAVLALNPVFLIVAGVAALVAGVATLITVLGNANAEYNALTATSKEQYNELQNLNEEYERTAAALGENSYEAQELKWRMEELEAEFESSKMTIEEFVAQNDALLESHEALVNSYQTSTDEIEKEERGTASLIGKLAELSSKTTLTASEQEQMAVITGKLNEEMPDLALAYDEVTGSLNRGVAEIRSMAKAHAELQRKQAQQEAYTAAIAEQIDLEDQLAKAKEQVATAEENKFGAGLFGASKQAHKDLEDWIAQEESLQVALDERNSIISETEAAWDAAANAAEEAAKAPVGYEDAVGSAIESVSEDLKELVALYDETYEASRNSLDGTFGLFEKVEEKAGVSSEAIIDAWQSQIDFFNQYDENLQALQEMDLDPKFLEKLSDGSQESAGQVQALVKEIENLSPAAAAQRIQEVNETFGELEQAKDTVAGTMTDIQTEFSTKLGEIETNMATSIDNMNMDTEAAAAAKSTISAYVSQIKSMTSEAHSAAAGVAKAAQNALGGGGGAGVGIPAHADGTDSAARGVALVGEEGPELVYFNGGEQVYTADETNRILSRGADRSVAEISLDQHTPATDGIEVSGGKPPRQTEEKKITLDINGSGGIDVTGADEDTVWGIVSPRLKEAFMGIIRTEILEEGDRAYAF